MKARNLLAGDITADGEVVECLGVAPGCCDVYYRPHPSVRTSYVSVRVVRYRLDDPVELLKSERSKS